VYVVPPVAVSIAPVEIYPVFVLLPAGYDTLEYLPVTVITVT